MAPTWRKKKKANYAIKKTKINKPWLAGVILKIIYRHKGWGNSKTLNFSAVLTQQFHFSISPNSSTCDGTMVEFENSGFTGAQTVPCFYMTRLNLVRAPFVYVEFGHSDDEPCIIKLGESLRTPVTHSWSTTNMYIATKIRHNDDYTHHVMATSQKGGKKSQKAHEMAPRGRDTWCVTFLFTSRFHFVKFCSWTPLKSPKKQRVRVQASSGILSVLPWNHKNIYFSHLRVSVFSFWGCCGGGKTLNINPRV